MPDSKRPPRDDETLSEYWEAIRPTGQPDTIERQFARTHPGDLIIATSEARELVRIHPDGTLTYGPEYTPDEAAVTFWTEMGRRRLQMEERLIQIQAMEQLLARVASADIAYETAQRRAHTETAIDHDKLMEEMSRRSLESRVHELIEYARGLIHSRPDLQTPPPRRPSENN